MQIDKLFKNKDNIIFAGIFVFIILLVLLLFWICKKNKKKWARSLSKLLGRIGSSFSRVLNDNPLKRALTKVSDWLARMMDMSKFTGSSDYEEERTSTFDWNNIKKKHVEDLKEWLLRLLGKEISWKDIQNNPEKIRFLYRRFIIKCMLSGYDHKRYLTPNETAVELKKWDDKKSEVADDLIPLYNVARYGGGYVQIDSDVLESLKDKIDKMKQ